MNTALRLSLMALLLSLISCVPEDKYLVDRTFIISGTARTDVYKNKSYSYSIAPNKSFKICGAIRDEISMKEHWECSDVFMSPHPYVHAHININIPWEQKIVIPFSAIARNYKKHMNGEPVEVVIFTLIDGEGPSNIQQLVIASKDLKTDRSVGGLVVKFRRDAESRDRLIGFKGQVRCILSAYHSLHELQPLDRIYKFEQHQNNPDHSIETSQDYGDIAKQILVDQCMDDPKLFSHPLELAQKESLCRTNVICEDTHTEFLWKCHSIRIAEESMGKWVDHVAQSTDRELADKTARALCLDKLPADSNPLFCVKESICYPHSVSSEFKRFDQSLYGITFPDLSTDDGNRSLFGYSKEESNQSEDNSSSTMPK